MDDSVESSIELETELPNGVPAKSDGVLHLVNEAILVYQAFHKSTSKSKGKEMNSSTMTNDPNAKVKLPRGLSADNQEILNSVNNSIAKLMVPNKLSDIWENSCYEVAQEIVELNKILEKLDLPPSNYKKEKSFPWELYDAQPNLASCHTKDFLDFYIFPFLLPAIHSLLDFAKQKRVFQCRYITFDPIDYIIEHLYNNNPFHPERTDVAKSTEEIAFENNWQSKFPRTALPKWLTMTEETAAIKIQRAFRGFLVRVRPDVSEMRQFWKDYQRDISEDGRQGSSSSNFLTGSADSDSLGQHTEDSQHSLGLHETHSDTCPVCSRYREFFIQQDALAAERAAKAKEEEERLKSENEAEESEYLEIDDVSSIRLNVNPPASKTSTIATTKTKAETDIL